MKIYLAMCRCENFFFNLIVMAMHFHEKCTIEFWKFTKSLWKAYTHIRLIWFLLRAISIYFFSWKTFVYIVLHCYVTRHSQRQFPRCILWMTYMFLRVNICHCDQLLFRHRTFLECIFTVKVVENCGNTKVTCKNCKNH